MRDLVIAFLRLYVPPDMTDMRAVYRFQLAQSVSLVSLWLMLWVVALWLMGRVPFIPQVAWAGQMNTVTGSVATLANDNKIIAAQLNDIRLLQLRASLETQLKYLCQAQRAGNQADLDNANHQMNDLTDVYFRLAGRPFTSPSCDTVLTGAK